MAANGMSGNNKVCVCYAVDTGGGKSQVLVEDNKSPTLTYTHYGEPAVCYGISGVYSNAMLSPNPHSGIYEAATSRTLDVNGGNPNCNQGGGIDS